VSRINDVGGMTGFPAVVEEPDEPPFHADWEAHLHALNALLIRQGTYNRDEFRDALERMPPLEYLAASYYERWFAAITTLLVEKGVLTAEDVAGPGKGAGSEPGTPGD
jgi:nitrile hydratase